MTWYELRCVVAHNQRFEEFGRKSPRWVSSSDVLMSTRSRWVGVSAIDVLNSTFSFRR